MRCNQELRYKYFLVNDTFFLKLFIYERRWHIHIAEFNLFLFNSLFCGKWWEKFPKNTKNIPSQNGHMQDAAT